jgi:hypothetical protein
MPLMMDGLKRRPQSLQWIVALLLLTMLWGSLAPVFAQDGSDGGTDSGGGIVTRECDPPTQCFRSVEARREYAAQNSCFFLEDVCTDFDPEAGNQARDEDRGFWGRLWDAGVGAIQYGYDFVRGLVAGLGDQISDLLDLLSDPVEAVRGLADLGRRFYEDPEGTIRSLAQLIGNEAVSMITRATRCGAYDLGRVIGQNINPVVVVRLGTRLARFGGNLDEAVAATRRDLGCASFVAGTPVLLPDGARAIEQIRKGDQVLSRHDESWSEAPQSVTETLTRIAPDIWELRTELETYKLTDNHPLWVQGKGWTQTKEVTSSDVLSSRNGDVRVVSNQPRGESARVYNFKVDNTPSYFVGEQGLWVHNPACGIYARPRSPSNYQIGASDGGPGLWEMRGRPDSAPYLYQAQVTGAPITRRPDGSIDIPEYRHNGVDFDGYDAQRNVLMDAKRYTDDNAIVTGGPQFLIDNTLNDARRQVAAASGTPVEWQVSNRQAVENLNAYFQADPALRGQINAVFVPSL